VDPLSLRDAGFLLTCGATLALIGSFRGARLTWAPMPLRWLAVSVSATLAVEAVVFPIGLWFFGRVSVAGVLLNIVAVPLMTVAQVAGLACVALDVVGADAQAIGWVAHHAVFALDWCTMLSQRVPGLAWLAPRPAVALLVLYYGALGGWWVGPRSTKGAAGIVAACVAGVLAVGPTRFVTAWNPVSGLHLTMFDVGQGDSLLVEADARRLLVDSGGRPFGEGSEIGRRVLVPALWARGATSLDALLVTHADPDHIGGAGAVLDAVPVRALWLGVDVPNHPPTVQLRGRAIGEGVPIVTQREGQTLTWGGARIRVLHPPEPDWERRRVRNDDSVVLEIVYGDVAVLLTGDISAEVERRIMPALTPARIRILKVAHHGSRTSSAAVLVEGWRPDIALVSCGRGNTFGHPAPEVLARLAAVGATVLRTDADGQITLWSDGRQVRARTYRGRQVWARPRA
jgi:competence protein ComEC